MAQWQIWSEYQSGQTKIEDDSDRVVWSVINTRRLETWQIWLEFAQLASAEMRESELAENE